jgi:hypothetical protein
MPASSNHPKTFTDVSLQAAKQYPIVNKYADHWPICSMLKLYLKYTSENARRAKDKGVAIRIEKAFGSAMDTRHGQRGRNDADTEDEVAKK